MLHFEVASSRGEIKILPKVLDLGPFYLNGSVDYPIHSKMLSSASYFNQKNLHAIAIEPRRANCISSMSLYPFDLRVYSTLYFIIYYFFDVIFQFED